MSIDNAAVLCQGTTSTTSCTELSGCVAHASAKPANWSQNLSWATCSTMATRKLPNNSEVWLQNSSTNTTLVDTPWLSFWQITKLD